MNALTVHQHLRLYVMRHGEIEQGRDPVYYGQTDVALSTRGVEQSHRLCKMVTSAPLVAVYASDLKRARYAADLIAQTHGLTVSSLPLLREINLGEWEGRSLAELSAMHPEMVAQLLENPGEFRYPGGESFPEFDHRVQDALQRILTTHENGEVALVTHGGVCRLIIGSVLELAPKYWLRLAQDFGCINIVDWYDGCPVLQTLNQTIAFL
ncbi:MAG: histidine phosphatase family protein [Candidatus Latescibacteria bacterium]|nr:histidine phosphatase family protein [Candidatus Latescibacterota bacterium]